MSSGTSQALNSEQDFDFNPDGARGPFPPGYCAPQKHRRVPSRGLTGTRESVDTDL